MYIDENQMLISFEWQKSFNLWVFLCLICSAEFCGRDLVGTWRFSKSKLSLDRQVTCKCRRGFFTLIQNHNKFNGHWICETGDAPFCEYKMIAWIDQSCALMVVVNSSYSLLKLVVIVPGKVEMKLFLAYQMITWSMSHVI